MCCASWWRRKFAGLQCLKMPGHTRHFCLFEKTQAPARLLQRRRIPELEALADLACVQMGVVMCDRVEYAEFSPNSRYIATAGRDNSARVWTAATGKLIASIKHAGHVAHVAFSPDSRWIVTATTGDERM